MMLPLKWLTALVLCAGLASTQAQSLRDPTLAPVEAGPVVTPVAAGGPSVGSGSITVVVRNGHPYLVVGTRLYAQGEKLGQSRIERISETEVWLREAGELRKVQRFSGVERHVASSPWPGIGCAPSALRPNPELQTGKAVKSARPSESSNALVKPGFPIPSAAVAPCVGVRP